jgi:hypothetical protein
MDTELQINENSKDFDIFGDQSPEDHVAGSHPFSELNCSPEGYDNLFQNQQPTNNQ